MTRIPRDGQWATDEFHSFVTITVIVIMTILTLTVSYHHWYPHVPPRRQYEDDWTGFGSRSGLRATWESPSSSCLRKVTSSKALNEDKQTPGSEVSLQVATVARYLLLCSYISSSKTDNGSTFQLNQWHALSRVKNSRTSHSLKSLTIFPHNVCRVILQKFCRTQGLNNVIELRRKIKQLFWPRIKWRSMFCTRIVCEFTHCT